MTYTIIISVVIIAALVAGSYFLAKKARAYITESITEIKKSQLVCQNVLTHINLGKLKEKVESHDITIRSINQIHDIAQRLEYNAKIYQDVVIQFTEKVTRIDDKLTEITTSLSDYRDEQSTQMKGIYDRLKKHDKLIQDMKEKLIKLEREHNDYQK